MSSGDNDQPTWASQIENPYLAGIYAPTIHESFATTLEVEGELPADLFGAYVRNGPNSVFEPKNAYHWFDGDGMVHAVYFRDGKASYRSRLVPTKGLEREMEGGQAHWPGIMGPHSEALDYRAKDTANTDVVWHNGNLLALWYLCGEPYKLDPMTLQPKGIDSFGGKRNTTVSAHPKVDERTGELVWFSLSEFDAPFMTYGVCNKQGELVHQVPIEIPGVRASHDITITENFSILHDFPFFHDPEILRKHGYRVGRFHRDLPSRFGVIPRLGAADSIRWFEFEPGFVLHMVNAWEEGNWIVMDGCFQPDPSIRKKREDGELASMLGYLRIQAHLRRWRMNMVTGECREEQLDDLNVEFPLPDTMLYGEKTRYSYHQYLPADMHTVEFRALVKYDHEDGSRVQYDYPEGWFGSESPFAPASKGDDEDSGYIVTIMTHKGGKSEAWVFDAKQVESGPLARVRLPSRVPVGFHAKWIPGQRIWSEETQ